MRNLLVVLLLVAAPAAGQEWGVAPGRYGGFWYNSGPEAHRVSPGRPYGIVGYGYPAPQPFLGYGYQPRYAAPADPWYARLAWWRQRPAEVACSYDYRCRGQR